MGRQPSPHGVTDVRAEPYSADDPDLVDLELFLAGRVAA
jgi:hypothetical protein